MGFRVVFENGEEFPTREKKKKEGLSALRVLATQAIEK
jgi:hypothetical protein